MEKDAQKRAEKMKALEEASKPLVDFVNEWCCPHDIITIEQGNVTLYSGEMAFPTKILD